MNILFTRFPLESAFGGAENQTINVMQGLSERGHAVAFLGSCPSLDILCETYHIPRTELNIGKPPVTKLDALLFPLKKIRMRTQLQNAIDSHGKLDVIFMLSLSEKILLTPYALKQGIKVIWIEHDKVGNWLTKNPSLPILKKLSKDVTTVCVSDLSANIFSNIGYQHVVAIPNGVPTPPEDFTKHVFDETLRLGCIARLSKEKGVDLLAEAVRSLDNVTLLVNGKGDQHIPSTPTITVKADVQNINDIYSAIDVLVLPSREEDPFGLVVAEAMLRGIAVICTDACGIAEYLHDGQDALVVKANSTQALAEAIDQLQDTELRNRIANAGLSTAKEKFTISGMVDRYEKLLPVY